MVISDDIYLVEDILAQPAGPTLPQGARWVEVSECGTSREISLPVDDIELAASQEVMEGKRKV